MLTAQRAKELTDAWLADRNKAYQEIAEQKLTTIYTQIEGAAKKGLSGYTMGNKTGFFKAQEVERIVRDKLTELGYTISTNGTSFTIRW